MAVVHATEDADTKARVTSDAIDAAARRIEDIDEADTDAKKEATEEDINAYVRHIEARVDKMDEAENEKRDAVVEKIVANVSRAIEEENNTPSPDERAPPPNQQIFDEVHIVTEPRYKKSKHSGDEWRISSKVTVSYKGRIIEEYYGFDVPRSVDELAKFSKKRSFSEARMKIDTSELCDQEGCSEPFTRTYKMKQEACYQCGHKRVAGTWRAGAIVRKFCERHAKRGDCGLEDADSNYEQVDGPSASPSTLRSDERKSVFGGVVVVSPKE